MSKTFLTSPSKSRDASSPHRELGLTDFEFDLICEKLDREPNKTELAIFSLLWSEHCGYKHSKKLLRTLPTKGPNVLQGPGENAGVVAIDDELACAFKVESHNHPSAVEPFEGAATGVGGIVRDIFAMGARPVALLNSLRFGELTSRRSRYLLERAVEGIGHYGNSIGVATVGGEVYFEEPYEHNCLINVMCVGLVKRTDLIRSAAAGIGNIVMLFGARTGRDGIGGASVLASSELTSDIDRRPSVQIGDPFEEKKLLECSLELLSKDLLVALQDLGAAGLSSSAAEMAAKGGVGLDIDIHKIPLREEGMEPFEVMVSESQERMLCVVKPEDVQAVLEVCTHWEVEAERIGEVTENRRLRVFSERQLKADIPVKALVDDCPLYDLDPKRPEDNIYRLQSKAILREEVHPNIQLPNKNFLRENLLALLGSTNICSRSWVFNQYDSIVGSATVRRPNETDAAVFLIDPANPNRGALAVSIDGNGRRVAHDPYRGAIEAVVESCANLAAVGAEPLGITNCLNFGNPEKSPIAWQLDEAINGIADVCNELSLPVVGGNVSLYNESPHGPIYPTPVIGTVGKIPDPHCVPALSDIRVGDTIFLVTTSSWEASLVASELAKLQGLPIVGTLPAISFNEIRSLHQSIRNTVRTGRLSFVSDISEGGLAVKLSELCIKTGLAANIKLHINNDVDQFLFGECPGAFLICTNSVDDLPFDANKYRLGQFTDNDSLTVAAKQTSVQIPISELKQRYLEGLSSAAAF